jgi:lipopolysaccharide transport system permease protein
MVEGASTSAAGHEPRELRILFGRLWRHRNLLQELVKRDLSESYAGSMLARAWAVLHPLLLIGLYLFVFGYIFTARVGSDLPAAPDFAVFMLSGLACWLTVQNALAKSTSSLLASANLVKQVVFPIELLPLRSVLSAQAPLLIGVVVVTVYSLIRFGFVSPLLPLVIYVVAAQTALLAGLALFLSAMTVFVRDTRDIVQFFTAFGVFLLPVIYLPGALPGWFAWLLWLNPLSHAIWCLQDIFFFRSFQHPVSWLALGALSLLSLWLGWRFFQRTRHNFGDVL